MAPAAGHAAALRGLDPVMIGGGVSRAWDVSGPSPDAVRDYAGLALVRRAERVLYELGEDAALLGAAVLARDPELV